MARAIILLVTVGVAIYSLVDLLRSQPDEVRVMPRFAWVLLIVVLPLVGSIGYLLFGRVGAGADGGKTINQPRRTVAPDDDPEFLRRLDWERRRKEQRPSPNDSADELGDDDDPKV